MSLIRRHHGPFEKELHNDYPATFKVASLEVRAPPRTCRFLRKILIGDREFLWRSSKTGDTIAALEKLLIAILVKIVFIQGGLRPRGHIVFPGPWGNSKLKF